MRNRLGRGKQDLYIRCHAQCGHTMNLCRRVGLIPFALALMLTLVASACGVDARTARVPNAGTQANDATLTVSASSPSSTPYPVSNPPIPAISVDTIGLHIQSDGGIYCGKYWVLASSRLNYDAGEIQQMRDYFSSYPHSQLPPTLRQVDGGLSCEIELDLTNTGSSSIQIPRVGVKLLAPSQRNTFEYRLIDICSLGEFGSGNCPPQGGYNPGCSRYDASVQLAAGVTGSTFAGMPKPFLQLDNGSPCPSTMTLDPTEVGELVVTFSSQNLTYRAVLQLTLLTASGQQILTLSKFPSELVFVAPNQFSCYKLQGDSFTLESRGSAVLSPTYEPPYQNCI